MSADGLAGQIISAYCNICSSRCSNLHLYKIYWKLVGRACLTFGINWNTCCAILRTIWVRQKILNNLFFVRLDYTFILHVNDKLVKRNNNIILLVLVIKSETWQNAEDHPIFTELRKEDVIKHFMKPTSCFTPRVWIGKSQDTTRIMLANVQSRLAKLVAPFHAIMRFSLINQPNIEQFSHPR